MYIRMLFWYYYCVLRANSLGVGPVNTIRRAPAIASKFELAYGHVGHHNTPTGARTRARQHLGPVRPLFWVLIRLSA